MEAQTTSNDSGTFECFEPEHYIPVPLTGISRVVCTGALGSGQSHQWTSFCRILKAVYAHEVWSESERAKGAWSVIHASNDHWWCDRSQRDEAMDTFLDIFLQTLKRANFRPIPYSVIKQAERDDFLYMLPLRVDWSKLDDSYLRRFYERHPEWRHVLPPGRHTEHMLIFVRGLGEETAEGRFLLQKIDLLVGDVLDLVVFDPFRVVAALCRRFLGRSEPGSEKSEGGDDGLVHAWSQYRTIHSQVRQRRVTLRQAGYGLRNLFRVTQITEPTFKEVVLLYRLCPPEHRKKQGDEECSCTPLQIRAYRDIPISDLEVIFPAKKMSMKPLDVVKLAVTALVGAGILIMRLLTAVLNPAVFFGTLISLAGYGSKVFFQFKVSRDRYLLLVTDALYSKHRDNDLGVILYLLDSVAEQECKEALLAYALLLTEGPLRESELDARAERLLYDRFGVRVDFESDDALRKLVDLGLARQDEDALWHVVPLDEALRILNDRWDDYFLHPSETAEEATRVSGNRAARTPEP